jgi:hypothetical protein
MAQFTVSTRQIPGYTEEYNETPYSGLSMPGLKIYSMFDSDII